MSRPLLDCGCPNDGRPQYGCLTCGHARCEEHRASHSHESVTVVSSERADGPVLTGTERRCPKCAGLLVFCGCGRPAQCGEVTCDEHSLGGWSSLPVVTPVEPNGSYQPGEPAGVVDLAGVHAAIEDRLIRNLNGHHEPGCSPGYCAHAPSVALLDLLAWCDELRAPGAPLFFPEMGYRIELRIAEALGIAVS